jgi:hypothetical protein
LLLLLRSIALQSSVPLQLPDRELDAFESFSWRGRGSSFHFSPHAQSRTLFPRTNYSGLQKQQQPTQSHGSLGLGKETETIDNCRRYERTLELHKSKLLIFGSQTQLSRFAAEKDAPSTQHQGSIVTTMVPLKRRRPKMRVRPWTSMIGRTPSQAPPAR